MVNLYRLFYGINVNLFHVSIFAVLGIKHRSSCVLGKCSTTGLDCTSSLLFSQSGFSCLCPQAARAVFVQQYDLFSDSIMSRL